jgi:hypothetical protein
VHFGGCELQPDGCARAGAGVLHGVRQSLLHEPEDRKLESGRRVGACAAALAGVASTTPISPGATRYRRGPLPSLTVVGGGARVGGGASMIPCYALPCGVGASGRGVIIRALAAWPGTVRVAAPEGGPAWPCGSSFLRG